jgi:hypothetical protein
MGWIHLTLDMDEQWAVHVAEKIFLSAECLN